MAVRNDGKHYFGICINHDYQKQFENEKDWVEKLNAVLFYKTASRLIRCNDCIVIDKDFQGRRASYIIQCMNKLFSRYRRDIPDIQFIPARFSKEVRIAHKMVQRARHKEISVQRNPLIKEEFQYL